ncbi:MAG: hypothetical protein ACOZAR_04975 [Patescibacteria group bacterium]
MPGKNNGELFARLGRLFLILVALCLAVILIYFVVLLATGQVTNPQKNINEKESEISQVQVPINILSGEIRKIEDKNIEFFDMQKNQLLQLTVLDYAVIDKYNPSTNINSELTLEEIQPVSLGNLTLDDQGQVSHITILPAVNISGEVTNNQAGVITLKSNNSDYTVRVNAMTKINKQKTDGTLENDLTESDIQVGEVISVVSDSDTKVGSKSFVAGLISILSRS